MTIHILPMTALAALALSMTEPSWAQQAPQAPEAAQPAGSALKSADRDFLDNAAQAGHLEMEGSKLALQKSHNEGVKNFAQRVLEDHGKAASELSALAARKNYKLPAEPSIMQRAKLKMLDVRDDSFDEAYVDQIGISAHEDAVKLFEDAAKDVQDADVKAFAAKTLPTLKSHLQAAQSLKQTIKPAK